MNLSTHKKSEVDLRVAQELKNNQDFIYETNQKLQSLGQGIISLSIQNEKLKTQADKDKKDIQIDVENHMQEVQNALSLSRKRVDKLEDWVAIVLADMQKRLDEFRTQIVHHEVLDEKFMAIGNWMKSFEYSHERLTGLVNSSANLLQGKIESGIEQVRKELTPEDVVDPIKAEVEELLNCMRVDFEGLVREIAFIKKNVSYNDKKFENIYTLIERLKTREK